MALVEEYKIGYTKIKIYDDACLKKKEEIEQALKRIAVIIGKEIGATVKITKLTD